VPRIVSLNQKENLVRTKSLFCESVHGVDTVRSLRMRRSLIGEYSGTLKEMLRVKIRRKNMDVKDLTKFFLLSESKEDLDICFALLQRVHSKHLGGCEGLDQYCILLCLYYFQLCFILELPEYGIRAWNDPILNATNFHKGGSRIPRLYMDLLFSNDMVQEVLETFKRDVDQLIKNFDCVTLACTACYKIGTKSVLEEAIQLLAHPSLVIESPRCHHLVALLAYNLGEFSVALELLTKCGSTDYVHGKTAEAVSLTVTVLVEMRRVNQAVLLLESHVGQPTKICYIALDKVLDAAKKSQNSPLISRVQNLMRDLKSNHKSVDEDLGRRLLDTIRPANESKTTAAPVAGKKQVFRERI